MSAAFAPPGRAHDPSPVSAGSEWSGMNDYNPGHTHNPSNAQFNGPMSPYTPHGAVTPPDSASLSGATLRGYSPNPRDGPPRVRRPSEASSRAGSVAHSRSSDGTLSDQQSKRYRKMEAELYQHYTVLKAFLRGGAQQPPRPNKARDKLLRLSPVQFHELSTDVFDELQRRQAATPIPGRPRREVPPFLQPRPEFHEKRNQARQKLSSLQMSRFRDLSTDVFCELERRFPQFGMPDGRRRDSARSMSSRGGPGRGPPPRVNTGGNMGPPNGFPPRQNSMPGNQLDNPPHSAPLAGEFGRPTPKQFQSNTVTPNKSTMVEDEDEENEMRSSDAFAMESAIASPSSDQDAAATRPNSDMRALQDKVSTLETTLQDKEDDITRLKRELDNKVEAADKLNQSLRNEVEILQAEHAAMKRESDDSGIWQSKHDQIQHDYGKLKLKYEEQQRITEEVSKQGEAFLTEMRAMMDDGGGSNFEREDQLESDVRRLQDELAEWKSRYSEIKTRLQEPSRGSIGPGIQQPNITRSSAGSMFRSPDGLVEDVHVTNFQMAIDELLQVARTHDPTDVLTYMRAVIVAVRQIALDIDAAKPSDKDEEAGKRRKKLKGRMSATANNFITACRSYAAAGGISPVSLLDAAASHLSAAVVDLARVVQIRPTVGEAGRTAPTAVQPAPEGTPEPVNEAGYFTMTQALRRPSVAGSDYSAISTPENSGRESGPGQMAAGSGLHQGNRPHDTVFHTGLGIQRGLSQKEDDTELQELKIYLENQTDLLVQTIQALVTSIRNEDEMASIHDHISAILDVVENVLSAAEGAMEDPSWYQAMLRQKASNALQLLITSKDNLIRTSEDPNGTVDGPASKAFTQRLPPLAFKIARDTKELVARIESVEVGGGEDEDYS